jgi:hypothetical protein
MDAGRTSRSSAELQTLVSSSSRKKMAKQNEEYRVFNRSRESFLSLEVTIFDSTTEPLKKLFDYLAAGSDISLWLKPYRGIPTSQGAKLFDLVYLDQQGLVTQEIEPYPNPELKVSELQPASALLLPAHTVFASRIRPGDLLEIRGSDELNRMLEALSNSTGGDLGGLPPSSARPHRMPPPSMLQKTHGSESRSGKKSQLGVRIKRWFFADPGNDQRSNRRALPGLIAYHWSGGTPQPYHLGNISETGFYLLTDERPYPGTLILMTLQKTSSAAEEHGNSVAVYSKVIRWGPDGVGFRFVTLKSQHVKKNDREPQNFANQQSLNAFLKKELERR